MCALTRCSSIFFFFFQAEDGIRDLTVTGVQTCALPIYHGAGVALLRVSRGRIPEGDLMTDAGDRPETLSRREMIAATAAALAAPLLPVPAVAAPSRGALPGRFLTPAELALLDELTQLIIPAG